MNGPDVATAALDWRWRAFAALLPIELQGIHSARQQVFVVEQACVFVDADAADVASHHLAAWPTGGAAAPGGLVLPVAYARVVAPGVKYAEPSIGRVVTSAAARGSGLGRELVRRAIDHCQGLHPGQPIRISAQSRLEPFYGRFGFVAVGARYLEDGIAHTEMLLPA